MRRLLLSALILACCLPAAQARRFHGGTPTGGGATLVFDCTAFGDGNCTSTQFQTVNDAADFNGSVIRVTNGAVGEHESGAVWYKTPLNIESFTTDLTFQITPTGYGMTFILQNVGDNISGDANGIGYFAYSTNTPGTAIGDSVAIVFNATPNTTGQSENTSTIGLFIDGGPYLDQGIFPLQDLYPQSVDLNSGDVMNAAVTYDGTTLSIVLTDTTTGAQAYYSWPVNIPSIVGADTAYAGMGAGTIPAVAQTLNSWAWYSGINTRLSSPSFSPAAGQYVSGQTVSLECPTGATCYYTTNGKPPTPASTQYTTAFSISASSLVQAIAVESGFSNSLPSYANYLIQADATPVVNFPSGFASASGLIQIAGAGAISSSTLQATSGTEQEQIGSAWYVAPVTVSAFSAAFTLAWSAGSGGTHNGMAFVLQNAGLTAYHTVNATFSALSSGATSATVTGGTFTGAPTWPGTTNNYTMVFSDGEQRTVTFTNNSTTISWSDGLTNSGVTSAVFYPNVNTGVSASPYVFGQGGSEGLNGTDGYHGIGNSVAVDFSVWNNTVGLGLDGGAFSSVAVTGITLGVHPVDVTLTYSGTTLSLSMEDTVTMGTFTYSWTVNIPSEVGASTAYAGFTGSSYDSESANEISSWTM